MDENLSTTINEEDNGENFKANLEEMVGELRTQAMLLGGRSMCVTIANMIDEELAKPGKRTMADMKRIIKKVRNFCQIAVNHPVEKPVFGEEAAKE